jgi:phenylacetate-CoA ligase
MLTSPRLHADLALIGLGTFRRPPASAAALDLRQAARLRQLVRHAVEHSPFYRDAFRRLNLATGDIACAADLQRLPVLEKATVREHMSRIAVSGVDLRTCPRWRSNGTTGAPFAMPVSRGEILFDAWLWARWYMACGHRPWQVQARTALPGTIRRRLPAWQRAGLFRRCYLSSADSPREKIGCLRRVRPDSLVAWATSLNELCTALERDDAFLDLPLVFSTSDMLWPDVRRRAEQRLHARVIDLYGAVETGPIARECPRGGYHVDSDLVIVELLDDQGRPAQRGRVVCTVLWRRVFPLIRYDLGDLAEWADGPCACGSQYPRLKAIHGREEDLVRLPDGTTVHSIQLRDMCFGIPGLRQYQMVQASPAQYWLRLVTGPEYQPDADARIMREFRRRFRDTLELRLVKVQAIHQPPEVKFTPMVTLERLERIKARGGDIRVFFEVE